MRERKFRLWVPEEKSFLHFTLTTPLPRSKRHQAHNADEYTGLKDKNGKEIYEGDILDDGGVIEFRNDLNWDSGGSFHSGFFSTKGYEYREDGCLSYHYQISEHEVIGSIHDNPQLIKGE